MPSSSVASTPWPEVWIGPVRVHDILRGEIIDALVSSSSEPSLIANTNAHAINLALKDPEFLAILNSARVCFCDGFGVMVLGRLFRAGRIRDRTTMPGFVEEVAARLHAEGKRIFLLGDEPGVAEAYGKKLETQWPGVVAGSHHGFLLNDPAAEAEALAQLRVAKADVVAIGMSMPLQEKWVMRHMHDLPPARYLPVGALFSWSTQNRRRGPAWATDHGLEWFFRLLYEPRRMWKRYLVGLPEVVVRLAQWHLRKGNLPSTASRLLLHAQVPPPVHGQSVMVGHLMDGLRASTAACRAEEDTGNPEARIVYHHINPQISEDLGDIGRWRPRKFILVFKFIAQAIIARFQHRLNAVYFVPAPPKRAGMYRDWVVLFFLRFFYPRLILHWHCIGQPEFVEQKLNRFERFLARRFYGRATLSIVLSNYSRDEAAYFASLRTIVVPNGIPDPCPDFDATVWPARQKRAEFLATTAPDWLKKPLIYDALFIAGRMTPKGLFDAMGAVTRANRCLAEQAVPVRIRLTVAGSFEDAVERQRYEVAARELNGTQAPGQAEPLAVHAGWADEARKKTLYRAADCFIFPTTYPAESFGLVIAEAMAHGCAVITTRWQAVPEVLPGGYENIVEPHDIDAMAATLLRCASAPADRSLRDYFLARFTSQRFAADMIRVLGEL